MHFSLENGHWVCFWKAHIFLLEDSDLPWPWSRVCFSALLGDGYLSLWSCITHSNLSAGDCKPLESQLIKKKKRILLWWIFSKWSSTSVNISRYFKCYKVILLKIGLRLIIIIFYHGIWATNTTFLNTDFLKSFQDSVLFTWYASYIVSFTLPQFRLSRISHFQPQTLKQQQKNSG